MTRVFVLTNHKGGVGKSTSATNIALGITGVLRRAGAANSRVLLIDTDSQGHATLVTTGRNDFGAEDSLYAVLAADRANAAQTLSQCIVQSTWDEDLHVLPASPMLEGAERELMSVAGAPYRLADPLSRIASHYAAVVIDTRPSFSLMTEMGLIAATNAIVPVEPRYLETVGLMSVISKINDIREGWRHPNLHISGILVTKMDSRIRGHNHLLDELKAHSVLGKLLIGVIPANGAVGELIFHNRYSYANSNPVNLTDPSGYCVGCQVDFRVNPADAGLPDQRDERLEFFRNGNWNFSGDIWGVLGREIDFVKWMQNSGRLTPGLAGNWYDVSDAYLTASRFAGERLANYIKSGNHCEDIHLGRLEPGVAEWAVFTLAAGHFPGLVLELQHFFILDEIFVAGTSTNLNIGFWLAHNAALREGVRRADRAGLRDKEPAEERALMNFILYDVLEPGDQCAAGNLAFCAFTFPLFLNIGTSIIMPQTYPATQRDLDQMAGNFRWIYLAWDRLGARPPDPQIHLIR